jgi:small subunit ribosomal protein S16
MPLVIRMSRHGRTNRPFFRIGVFDLRTRRDGPPVEALGWYDPREKDAAKQFKVDAERVGHWFSKGARVSPTVRSFLERAGVPVPRTKTTRDQVAKDAPRRERAAARRASAGKPKPKAKA